MVDLHSGRFFKDVGPVEVDAKQHEVMPGVKEVLAKQGAQSGLNSTATVDANVKAVVGADGKGVVNVTVVAPEGPEPDKKAGAKPAKPATPAAKGTVNNQPAGVTGAVPTPTLAAVNPTRRLGRTPGRGVAVRPNPTVTRQQSQALTANQSGGGALAVKRDDVAPKADKLKNPKQDAKGPKPLAAKQVAVNVNLQETRRAKILSLMQGGNMTPDKDPKDLPQPHTGRRRDHHKALDRTGFAPNASSAKLGGPTADAKPQQQQRITPATAKMAALPATSPRPGSSTF